jgi:AbrB family looped-hinge helix DNA binding protein
MNFAFATVSPKFQIAIPKAVREEAELKAGTKVVVFPFDGKIEIVPVRPIQEARGMLKGMDTTIIREPDREL